MESVKAQGAPEIKSEGRVRLEDGLLLIQGKGTPDDNIIKQNECQSRGRPTVVYKADFSQPMR